MPPGPARAQKRTQQIPARLPSGAQVKGIPGTRVHMEGTTYMVLGSFSESSFGVLDAFSQGGSRAHQTLEPGRKSGKPPKSALRPAFGRPEGRFWCFPGSSPAKIRPGSPISGLEALLRNIE